MSAEEWEWMRWDEGKAHTVRAGLTRQAVCVNGVDGVAGMQYLNTAHGRRERERETGRPEPVEKVRMVLKGRGITFAVKDTCNLQAGEEMRIAYKWSSAQWERVRRDAVEEGDAGVVRGWVEGDRFGPTHGAGAAAAAYRDDDADVLRDAASLEDETGQGSEGQEGTVLGLGGVDYEYKDWMDPDWQVPDTVEEVNRLWEEHRMVGWWREGSTRAREGGRVEGEGIGGGRAGASRPLRRHHRRASPAAAP